MAADRDRLAKRFAAAEQEFNTSPLYGALGHVIAGDPLLLDIAARGRAGQQPTNLLFAAVHHLVLAGTEHELAAFYPSVAGTEARPPGEAGPALRDFAGRHEAELTALVSTRLVQTNVVKRSVALRLGLAAVAAHVDEPVHLIEVGASAGIHLRFDRYGSVVGDRRFGDPSSPVQIDTAWIGATPPPDLDALPALASTTGIDLYPVDPTVAEDRRWLRSLVWPENAHEAELLERALEVVAADPPEIRAGDAIELCPTLAAELPAGAPRVVFHAATRAHVPQDRRADFDAAIDALGASGPLYHLSLEGPLPAGARPQRPDPAHALRLRLPSGDVVELAIVEGHADWIEPA